MPSLIDMRNYLENLTTQNVELLGITTTSPNRTTSFQMSGGSPISKDMQSIDLTLTVRSSHPSEAEKDVYEWYELLNNKTNTQIANTQIILIRAISYPTFLGRYDNGLFYFSITFSLLMET
jgi:hypothetical protein